MDILRFITAGNVDDGKSTLIGRLLYDTGNIKTDVLQSVSGDDAVNLAHITDGLRSERAQGITIDVAYKYFTTTARKYIITDAPGHFQYTKNLVTGASAADVIIILIDARNGITEQTKRHSLAASFLQIKQVIIAVNKMDAIGYSEAVFMQIKAAYEAGIAAKLNLGQTTFIPISALHGDNVITPSGNMPWYTGPSLMQWLDAYTPAQPQTNAFRLAVQYASTKEDFQMCFGKIISGNVRTGDSVSIFPADKYGTIHKIGIGTNLECNTASEGQNVCLFIESAHLIKRGDMLCNTVAPPQTAQELTGSLCWLDTHPMTVGKEYLLQINNTSCACTITNIVSKTDVNTFEKNRGGNELLINEFAVVAIHTAATVVFDSFAEIPPTGRGIIIDKESNYTCGAFTIN